MKYKWILFDADNTLFDYDKGEANALKSTFEQLGFPFKPEYLDIYKQVNHDIWQELEQGKISPEKLSVERFKRYAGILGLNFKAAGFSERYLNNLSLAAELIDGAQEIVESLHGKIGMLIITNGLQAVQRPRLERSMLKTYIKDIIISEEVGSGKPDAPIFDTAFARMGHPSKEEVLIVGDSLTSDIRGGLNYGIDTCWFNPAQKEDNPEIKSLFQIKKLNELVNIILV
jgi:2-haloacid dehalogenase